MKELLEKLKSLDPTTYGRVFDWFQNVIWELIKDDPEGYFLEDGPYPLRDALLQACLQDAIGSKIDQNAEKRKHTWGYTIEHDRDGIIAWVHAGEVEYPGYGESPTKSLLAAYITACEDAQIS